MSWRGWAKWATVLVGAATVLTTATLVMNHAISKLADGSEDLLRNASKSVPAAPDVAATYAASSLELSAWVNALLVVNLWLSVLSFVAIGLSVLCIVASLVGRRHATHPTDVGLDEMSRTISSAIARLHELEVGVGNTQAERAKTKAEREKLQTLQSLTPTQLTALQASLPKERRSLWRWLGDAAVVATLIGFAILLLQLHY